MLPAVLLASLAASVPAFADFDPMPVRGPMTRPPQQAPREAVYNWSSIYIGGHGGYVWSKETGSTTFGIPLLAFGTELPNKPDGVIAGGQAGFNFQIHRLVMGVEVDGSWTNERGSVTITSLLPGVDVRSSAEHEWYLIVAGRVGWAITPDAMMYFKGGAAWKQFKYVVSTVAGGVVTASTTIDDFPLGWTVGGGIEIGIDRFWSVKVEYNYVDFGDVRFNLAIPGQGLTALDVRSRSHIVKGGLNLRFGLGPPAIVTRY